VQEKSKGVQLQKGGSVIVYCLRSKNFDHIIVTNLLIWVIM